MREYIINWHGVGSIIAECWGCSTSKKAFLRIREEKRKEQIVRCRDCIYAPIDDDSYPCCQRWWREWMDGYPNWHGKYAKFEPDGYCAWGERMEDA